MQLYQALEILGETSNILHTSIRDRNQNQAIESVSVLLMQGLDLFGYGDPLIGSFFETWGEIKTHIERSEWDSAMSKTEAWLSMLNEVRGILSEIKTEQPE